MTGLCVQAAASLNPMHNSMYTSLLYGFNPLASFNYQVIASFSACACVSAEVASQVVIIVVFIIIVTIILLMILTFILLYNVYNHHHHGIHHLSWLSPFTMHHRHHRHHRHYRCHHARP
jgi:hypothetical protein